MNPEGIVVWHTAANVGFKQTLKDDGMPKSLVSNENTSSL
jgi:H+/gluconate symporter-like permease